MNPRRPDYVADHTAGRADRLTCRATVLKPGSMMTIVEAEVRALDSLIAKMRATVAVVPAERNRR